ncbi:unnamed protein product, partial [marine sediment metagenome]
MNKTILLTFVFALLCVGLVSALSTGNLVAYYSFDVDATDSSGNGYDGSVTGDLSLVEGVLSNANNFTGDDRVYISDSVTSAGSNWSACLWVYPNSAADDDIAFHMRESGTASENLIVQFRDDNNIDIYGDNGYGLFNDQSYGINAWYFICVTMDNATSVKTYYNSTLKSTDNSVTGTFANEQIWIGSRFT